MKWCHFSLIVVVLALVPLPAPAGIIFNRHPKVNPAQRIPALIMTLKSDPNERKRTSAAEELREFDPAAYPEVIPALVDGAMNDPKAAVRLEAVQSLGKLRPVSQQAGWALEQIEGRDESLRVRWQARSSLMQYRLAGYHSQGDAARAGDQPRESIRTGQPPLDVPGNPPAVVVVPTQSRIRPVPSTTSSYRPQGVISSPIQATSAEPPLLEPTAAVGAPPAQPTPATPAGDGPDITIPR